MTVLLGIPLAVALVALLRAYRDVGDAVVTEWADAHALTLTAANRPMVQWYLHTARVLRTWGALAGAFLPSLWAAALGDEVRLPQSWTWVFVGYLVGALYAELSLVRPVGAARRTASLVPRELEGYLPARLVRLQRGLGVASVAGALLVGFLPYGERSDLALLPNSSVVIAMAAVAAGFAVALERLQRWLVQRPQPFVEADLIAADDAIRSQSLHSLAGSGIAVLLLFLSTLCWAMAASDVQVLRWTMWVPGFFGFLAALWACQYYGHRAWRVRRALPGAWVRTS